MASLLKSAELRLLRCTFSPPTPPPSPLSFSSSSSPLLPQIHSLITSIELGRYSDALRSEAARLIFPFASLWPFLDSEESADGFYAEAERCVEAFVVGDDDAWLRVLDGDDDRAYREFAVMCVAVASLMAFLQRNMTGPVEEFPAFPLGVAAEDGGKWDVWARNQLTSSGSDMFGKISMVQYIVFSKLLLSKLKKLAVCGSDSNLNGSKSISWWLLRVIILQQRILDDLSSSLYGVVENLVSDTLDHFGELESIRKYWDCHLSEGEASSILSMVHLEVGIIENIYGRVDSARIHFTCAEVASGLHLSLTGALGVRTIHQVDAKAQMILVADTGCGESNEKGLKCSDNVYSSEYLSKISQNQEENSDILMIPRLLENGDSITVDVGGLASKPLTAIQQAVILSQCLYINRTNPDDELSRWKVAPFIEAIDAQQESHFIIRCFCGILRIRWESTRSRTKQRSVVMMNKLVDHIFEDSPGAAQRILFYYGVHMPTIPALQKEYGILLVGNGMIGEALQIFEDLELWDNLIYCYRLLGKKAAAVDLIKARLVDLPYDPRLWCALGDVTNSDAYYEKALEVSRDGSARAKRSLARSAYNRGDYEKSKTLWESAMTLNSLHPDGWFALGAAALKARDVDKALDGFTRAVQLDPENGEAWNNIACLHMIKKRFKESFIAFKEALKFRRTSWQLWQNYSHVAFETGNFVQALDGTQKVLDLSSNKQIDTELLEKLTLEIEQRISKTLPSSLPCADSKPQTQISQSGNLAESIAEITDSGVDKLRETEIMIEKLGKALQQIVKSSGGDGVWGLYARWHRIKGDLSMCSEALLKEVRSYQGSELWSNQDRFRKFARASLELCNCYMEISQLTGSRRELSTADMHLRNSIKQAVNFSDTQEVRLLQKCLDNVKDRLLQISVENRIQI